MLVISFSLIGPAIIFTMLVFAQVSAFGIDSSIMMQYNMYPVVAFTFLCFFASSRTQLIFAKLASVIYAFVMLAVLIATTIQIVLESELLLDVL
jgi:hypothetical protein